MRNRNSVNDWCDELELHRRDDNDAPRGVAREETGRSTGGEGAGEGGPEVEGYSGLESTLQRRYKSPGENQVEQPNESQGRKWETGSAFD